MTTFDLSLEELIYVREKLINTLLKSLTQNDREFLLGIKQGVVQGEKLYLPEIDKLPGIQWKLMNIDKMTIAAKTRALEKLAKILGV